MNYVGKIDNIFSQISEGKNNLSIIIPQIYSIALHCKDYVGFCILFMWEQPMGDNKISNQAFLQEQTAMLLAEGLKKEVVVQTQQIAFEKFLNMKTMGEKGDGVCVWSVKEIEDFINGVDDILNSIEPPKELAQIDLYYRSQTAQKEKLQVLEKRQTMEKHYASIHSYVMSLLSKYRRQIEREERSEATEKLIHNSNKVFIIHGHDEARRRELEKILKEDFHLEPVVLLDKPNQGMTIIEKFEKYAVECSFAFALFTPDDIVSKGENDYYFQARPNVIFELGWFYSNLGRSRVCVLDQASEKSNIFSDLQGVLRIQFDKQISEKYKEIERELKSVGILR